jgi:hypothetical protein
MSAGRPQSWSLPPRPTSASAPTHHVVCRATGRGALPLGRKVHLGKVVVHDFDLQPNGRNRGSVNGMQAIMGRSLERRSITAAPRFQQAQHSTAQHSTAQHSTAQHSTAQRSTAQQSKAQNSTALHSTAPCPLFHCVPARWLPACMHACLPLPLAVQRLHKKHVLRLQVAMSDAEGVEVCHALCGRRRSG